MFVQDYLAGHKSTLFYQYIDLWKGKNAISKVPANYCSIHPLQYSLWSFVNQNSHHPCKEVMGAFNLIFLDWERVTIQGTYIEVKTLAKCFYCHTRISPCIPIKHHLSDQIQLHKFVCKFLADFNSNYSKNSRLYPQRLVITQFCIMRG